VDCSHPCSVIVHRICCVIEYCFYLGYLWDIKFVFSLLSAPVSLITTINERCSISIRLSPDSWPRALCVICQVRPAEAMTYVCKDEKCYQIFMDYQAKGKLKELLDISEE
jgi:hypothetical protein